MKPAFLFMLLALISAGAAGAEDYGPTARGMFALLPPSIFENTPEGLSEAARQDLLHTGRSEFWEIAGETPDVLVLAQLPFRDRSVAFRVFRNNVDGSAEVAVGTLGSPVCTVELWRVDPAGRILPVDTPDEPEMNEFFRKKRKKDPGQTVLICLGPGGLAARPVFWSKKGVIEPKVDYDINFVWNGSGFEKKVIPARNDKN